MKNKEELKKLNERELVAKIEAFKREQFTLRLNATTAHVKDHSQFKKLRKNVARAYTYLRQKSQ